MKFVGSTERFCPSEIPGARTVTNVFEVVGEHREEPSRLLLRGEDGLFYAYATSDSHPTAVEPSEEWELDAEVDGT